NVDGNAVAQMAANKPITLGAVLDVTSNGQTERVRPLYRMNPTTGIVESPPATIPGGGMVVLSGINAGERKVQLLFGGLGVRPRLALDVTHKPLIKLVWGGLYIVLAGGILAALARIRELRIRDGVAGNRTPPSASPA